MKFDLNDFQIVEKQSFGGKRAATQPFVGIDKHGITFNVYIGKHYAFAHQKYAQVFIDSAAQKLAVVFFDKFDPNSFKVMRSNKSDGTHISTSALCKHLTENTDLINTNVFRYKFVPEIDNEQQIIMIDLKNPFSKIRIKK